MNKYKNSRIRLFVLIFAAAGLVACSGSRKAVKEPIKEQGAEYLMGKLKENELKYQQFSAKFNATYEVDQKQTSVSGSIRIEKDSIIWISISPALGIEAVRFMLTPDSIKYLNRLSDTYLLQGFDYINKLLNKSMDYDMAQAFLTGNDFSFYDSSSFKASVDNKDYKLNTVNRSKIRRSVRRSDDDISIPIQYIWLNSENFKISKVLIKESERDSRKFIATYSGFQDVDAKLIPTNLEFKAETEEKKISIKITYSRLQINQKQNYLFKIPEGYSEIKDLQPEK
jgi:hypothetical protein